MHSEEDFWNGVRTDDGRFLIEVDVPKTLSERWERSHAGVPCLAVWEQREESWQLYWRGSDPNDFWLSMVCAKDERPEGWLESLNYAADIVNDARTVFLEPLRRYTAAGPGDAEERSRAKRRNPAIYLISRKVHDKALHHCESIGLWCRYAFPDRRVPVWLTCDWQTFEELHQEMESGATLEACLKKPQILEYVPADFIRDELERREAEGRYEHDCPEAEGR